jgi:hypothetical protein
MRALKVCLIGLVVAVVCGSRVSAAILMGDWKLKDVSGGVAPDSSGNGNNGVVYGTPTLLPGLGLHFDGVDDYIEIPGTSAWNFPGGFTIEVTFRCSGPQISASGDAEIVSKHVSGVEEGYILGVMSSGTHQNDLFILAEPPNASNGPYARIYGPNVLDPTDPNSYPNWHEAVAMYDGASLSLSLDGSSQKVPWQYDSFSPANIRIGYLVPDRPGSYFLGDINEVKIYDGATPEPSTLIMLLSGLGISAGWWRRKRAA